MRTTREPGLTVIVIVLMGGSALERCVQCFRVMPVAVIVVGRLPAPLRASLHAAGVRAIDSDAPVPRLRALGLAQASTEWVGFCEDTCEPVPSWYAAFCHASQAPQVDAWSGPITLRADLPARCLALAALEYGEFAPTRWQRLAADAATAWRPMSRLAGLNWVCRAAALPVPAHGIIETEVHQALHSSGRAIALHPDLAVAYTARDFASATAAARAQHGRIYGGGQRARLGLGARGVALAKCLLLPAVLWARGVAGLPPSRRANWRAHAWLWWLATAWSLGEACGLAFGRGRSVEAWR